MANINVIKKSKEITEDLIKTDSKVKEISKEANELAKLLAAKRSEIAKRDAAKAEAVEAPVAEVKAEPVNEAKAEVQAEAVEVKAPETKAEVKEPAREASRPERGERPERTERGERPERRFDGQQRPQSKPGERSFDRPQRPNGDNKFNGNRDNKFTPRDDRKPFGNGQQRGGNSFGKDKDDDDDNKNRHNQSHARPDNKAKDRDNISNVLGSKPADTNRNFGSKAKDKIKRSREDYWDDGKPNAKGSKNNQKFQQQSKAHETYVAPERKKAIVIGDSILVKDFSESVGISVAEIVKKLMSYGVFATINNEIDFDTAQLVAEEFGITVTKSQTKSAEDRFDDLIKEDNDESKMVKRPPIVTVMGHVDHGKTSLLDAIRNGNVASGEAGGITQRIGAYTVNHNGNKITFLDTPGHEAFTTMRSRGAKVTDVAVIVVAANDGVMPQTIEAIHHAKAAETPIIIAMNKMDLYGVNPETVKKQLAENDVLVEDWGGDVPCIPVSAKTKQGIDELLEMILLVTDMHELKANPDTKAKGTIIEARLDKSVGPVATILVQNGTLREGDTVVAGMTYGNVRAMFDHNGKRIKKAGPSIPVEITGLNEVPQAGDMIFALEDSKLTKSIVEERISKYRESTINASKAVNLDDLFNQIKEGEVKSLNIIIKADVQGSVEAVKQSLEKLSNDEVKVCCIHGAVGAITEADVSLAKASNAFIIGFNVRTIGNVDEIAQASGVDIRNYSIIYNAIDDVQAAMKGMLAPVFKEVIHGRVEVRTTFKITGVGTVAGCYVTKGKIGRHDKIRVLREGIVIHDGELESLKRFKDDVKEVAEGYECGMGIKNFNDIKEGDEFEAYAMEEIKA